MTTTLAPSTMVDDLKMLDEYACHTILDQMVTAGNQVTYTTPQLIFPLQQNKSNQGLQRVSEQEARFAYIHALIGCNSRKRYFYSVETPTVANYAFQNAISHIDCFPDITGGTSAQVDLSLYTLGHQSLVKCCDIEFKSGHDEFSVTKDMAKLVAEPSLHSSLTGHWLQMLECADENTFDKLFAKLRRAFEHVDANILPKLPSKPDLSILFTLYLLDPAYRQMNCVCKHFTCNTSVQGLKQVAAQFFDWPRPNGLSSSEKGQRVITQLKQLGWEII